MIERGTRTPAQQQYDHAVFHRRSNREEELAKSAMLRAEEIASDVRALAATVAEQADEIASLKRKLIHTESWMASYDDAKSEIIARLAALERGQWTLSQSVQSLDRDHVDLKGRMDEFIGQVYVDLTERIEALEYQRDRAEADADDLEQIRSRVLPQSPGSAEAAPVNVSVEKWHGRALDDLCECGHLWGEHIGENRCGECSCALFVPAEQSVQEPPALDPCIDDIITQAYLYGSARCAQGVEVGAGRDSSKAVKRMIFEWDMLVAAIRAYGADAREGGK